MAVKSGSYTHAHLRYCEALAHIGNAEEFFRALSQINPIGIPGTRTDSHAASGELLLPSSDAAFADRYEASLITTR